MDINDEVIIMDGGSSYYKEEAKIIYISNGQYCIKMNDGYLEIMFEKDIEKVNK